MTQATSDPARRRPALFGALLSAVLPGAGQWFAGARQRALIVFAPFVVLVIAGAVVMARTTNTDLIATFVQPRNLWALVVGNVVVVAWRLFATFDAYRLLADTSPGPWVWAGLAGLFVLVATPHAIATAYGIRGIEVLENVFVVDEPNESPDPTIVVAAPSGDPDEPASNGDDHHHDDDTLLVQRTTDLVTVEYRSIGLIFQEGIGDPDAIAIRRDLRAGATTAAPFVDFASRVGEDRLTILLAGGDRGPGREGLRTDTMMVATVDMATGEAAIFGIPRNYKRVPLANAIRHQFDELAIEEWEWEPDLDEDGFPDDWEDLDGDEIPDEPEIHCHCFPEILNHLHGEAQFLTNFYPDSVDPGMDALAATLGEMIGLPVDYWLLVDMSGFVRLIDAMGGVTVWVTDPLHVGVSPSEEGLPTAIVDVEPGYNTLSGSEALAYVRWRRGSSDYVRMGRQRCLIRSVMAEADPVTLLRSFTSIASAIEDSVVTNIPLSLLPDLVEVMGRVDLDEVSTLGLIPPHFSDGRTPGRYPIPHVERMRAAVNDVLENGTDASRIGGESECGI